MGMADSIFEPHPPNFGKSDIFWRSTNGITIIFGNFHYCKSFKKCTQAIRPGVEESLYNYINLKVFSSNHYCISPLNSIHLNLPRRASTGWSARIWTIRKLSWICLSWMETRILPRSNTCNAQRDESPNLSSGKWGCVQTKIRVCQKGNIYGLQKNVPSTYI